MSIHLHMDVRPQMPVLTDVASGVPQVVSLEQEQLFPIREVARLTGVNPVTLRAWEWRYGLIVPTRTESGHRLYSMTDIERVRSILGWIDRGVAVSKIGTLLAGSSIGCLGNEGEVMSQRLKQFLAGTLDT